MADNVVADPGALGATFATDDIGGVHYPINKLTFGALDSQTLASSGNGVTTAGTQRVTLSSDGTGVIAATQSGTWNITNISGTIALPTGAATSAGQLADGHNVTVDNASGVSAVNIQDGGNSITVDNGGTFATQATLQAGTAEIGKLAAGIAEIGNVANSGTFAVQAAQSGTWNITNISGTVSLPTGAATSALQLPDGHNVTIDNAAGAAAVNIQDGGNSITVDNAGSFAVDSSLQAGTALVGKVSIDQVTANANEVVTKTGSVTKLEANTGVDIGDVDVTSIAAGSNLIGDVGLSGARTSGGTTLYKNIDVDESEDAVKATAGQVYWIHAINTTAAIVFLKFYNATVASVIVGTTVPDLTFPVPGNSTTGAGFTLSIPNGIEFGTAITIAATTGVADNDSGAPGANALVVNLGFA